MTDQQLPESAVAYLDGFVEWAKKLPLEDVKQVIQLLQAVRQAHVMRVGFAVYNPEYGQEVKDDPAN